MLTLPTTIENTLLRIVDEGLANVLRHSAATNAILVLHRDHERVSLVIADNGHGVSSDAPAGMGLTNMRERAESLPRGEFVFETSPATGTRISVHWSV
jgi:signal transduction histidine kinase